MRVRPQTDVVVDNENRKLRGLGVREQDLTLVEQKMLHEIRAGVREMTRGVVMERDDSFVDV